jgi:hypothetical protein
MIEGLHPKMISNFIAVKPKTFAEFYQIAKTANFKQNQELFNENKFKPKSQSNQNNSFRKSSNLKPKNNYKANNRPPNPCKICESLGLNNRYHWATNCFNKAKAQSDKKINIIENNTETNEGFNEIDNIDLN